MKLKKALAVFLCLLILSAFIAPMSSAATKNKLTLVVPEDWELTVGDSRTVDYTFNKEATLRTVLWSSSDTSVATVDNYGRVTAVKTGTAVITGTSNSDTDVVSQVTLKVVKTATSNKTKATGIVNYTGTAAAESTVLQKLVDRYSLIKAKSSKSVPAAVKSCISSTVTVPGSAKKATTADGAIWTIEAYGVKRYNSKETNERDKTQRFMGDRYFYTKDASVLGIFADGANGIWTISSAGITHIRMEKMSYKDKAILMSDNTQKYVSRRGMVSDATYSNSTWKGVETDNDGLWTSMYGAGELFRYATLKKELAKDPNNKALKTKVAAAKKTAAASVEAVLLLSNISCRTETAKAYVRYQTNGGKWLSDTALVEGGDGSLNIPDISPSETLSVDYLLNPKHLAPFDLKSWVKTVNASPSVLFAKRTRLLTGFIARTYILDGLEPECPSAYDFSDGYYYKIHRNTAIAHSPVKDKEGTINGEYRDGQQVDASGTIPARLMKLIGKIKNPKTGDYFTKNDIIYKGDTSCDELIGHLFIYKLAYDILGKDDPELMEIIVDTVDNIAQHISDNSYMLVDSTGQPTTWGKMNREFLYNSSTLTDAPLTASVLLNVFKVAAYVTGDEKWEKEYVMAASSESYKYADIMTQYWTRLEANIDMMASQLGISLNDATEASRELLIRTFINYSDEEMAMLSFYLLFQMENDEALLAKYRTALDQWWKSMKYSENPLWYYIYQLAYPNSARTDAYGNNLLQTASWALSRHPIETICYNASNDNREDIAVYDLGKIIGQDTRGGLSYNKQTSTVTALTDPSKMVAYLNSLKFNYAVAPADERSLHKFNGSTYTLSTSYEVNKMEGSTTYTLPYWLGRYHNLLTASR